MTEKTVEQIKADFQKQKAAVLKKRPHAICFDPTEGMTKQSFHDECDINQIMDKAKNGIVPTHINQNQPMYGDFTQLPSYQGALDTMNHANRLFMKLDSDIRKRFDNDPQKLMDFLHDPKNKEEGIRLGFFEKPAPASPVAPAQPAGAQAAPSPNPPPVPNPAPNPAPTPSPAPSSEPSGQSPS